MKRLLTFLLVAISLNVFAQSTATLPAGAVPYSTQIYRVITVGPPADTTWYTGASGKSFVKLSGYRDVLRIQDSISALRTSINGKVDKITGKGLSTEDYSTAEKSKLGGIATGATANRSDAATDLLLDAKINLTEKGAVNGVASLNSSGKVPNTQIPALALVDTYVAASQAAMLALSLAEQGDIAIRTDLSKTYILADNNYSNLSSWIYLPSPVIPAETDPVWGASASAGITAGNISNWNTAFSQTRQWDGGATELVAATGRASLGLGSGATYNSSDLSNPSTLALRDGAGNGVFKAIILDTDGGLAISSTNQTIGQVLGTWSNTSGSLKWGIENNVGGNYATGLTAYSSFFGTATNTPVHLFTNGVVRQTISGSGATTFSSTIAASNFSGTHSGTSSNTNTGDQTITLTGPVTGSGVGSFATTIGAGQITNANLANSTISGIALGSNLAALTFGTYLTANDASYNGSAAKIIGINAAIASIASTIVARDGSGGVNVTSITAYGSEVLTATNQLTGGVFSKFANTLGSLLYGVYNDSGTGFGSTNISGMTANATGFGNTTNTPVQFFTNGVVRQTISGTGATSFSGSLSASNLSGSNTGDQTSVTGNAGTATALQTARTIQGVSFNGTANINVINGTGLVRASGTTLSYDNASYLTTTANNGQAHSTISTSAVIPFTTWTTFYTMPATAGIYLVTIGLDGQDIADWVAAGIIYTGGTTAAFFSQHNASLVQIRLSNQDIQIFQNGGSPNITLSYRVLKIQ